MAHNNKCVLTRVALSIALSLPVTANAALLDLQDIPLFIGTSAVEPNVLFVTSGGFVDAEVTAKPSRRFDNDARLVSFNTSYAIEQRPSSAVPVLYLFNNFDNEQGSVFDAIRGLAPTMTMTKSPHLRCSCVNGLAYDPSVLYQPWPGYDYAEWPNVKSHPNDDRFGFFINVDLSRGDEAVYSVLNPAAVPDEGKDADGNVLARYFVEPDDVSLIQITDTAIPDNSTFTLFGGRRNRADVPGDPIPLSSIDPDTELEGCPKKQVDLGLCTVGDNYANWYQYHRRRSFAVRNAIASVVRSNPRLNYGLVIDTDIAVPVEPNGGPEASRAFVDKVLSFEDLDAGFTGRQINTRNQDDIQINFGLDTAGLYLDGEHPTEDSPIEFRCQQNFAIAIPSGGYAFPRIGWDNSKISLDGGFESGSYSTPNNPIGLDRDAGIIPTPAGLEAANALTFPSDRKNSFVPKEPFPDHEADKDGIQGTLADIAKNWYDTRLRTDLPAGEVPINPFDENPDLHMVTFSVGLGAAFNVLTDDDLDGLPGVGASEYQENDLWLDLDNVNTFLGPARTDKVTALNMTLGDDLWHATFNSKGRYIRAENSSEVRSALVEHLIEIGLRSASAVSVAASASTLTTESRIFQARFDSDDWSGQVRAYQIDVDGTLGEPVWEAGCNLTTADSVDLEGSLVNCSSKDPEDRSIFTWNAGSNTGVAFSWDNLSDSQRAFLQDDPTTKIIETDADAGNKRLLFLRGSHDDEGEDDGEFRQRNRTVDPSQQFVLGDVLNSIPILIPPPGRTYPDGLESSAYSAFVSNNAGRPTVLYVGSNDGMLHAFREDTGEELFAFVPNEVYPKLPELTNNEDFVHQAFVDAPPAEGDVFTNNSWRTALVGGLGHGGQAIYALDITDPVKDDSEADSSVLWEFSDAQDADLGYVYGKPQIVKMSDGKWYALVGNGYNSIELDVDNPACTDNDVDTVCTTASTTGRAFLFAIPMDYDPDTDSGVVKISTDELGADLDSEDTPNGLSTPFPVDLNGDFIVDYVYAGDLRGRIWRFDVTSKSPSAWQHSAVIVFDTAWRSTITTGQQPITTRPVIGRHPSDSSKVIIYFGTGRYLGREDSLNTGQVTQTFYAIVDEPTDSTPPVLDETDLLEQTVVLDNNFSRVTSDNAIDFRETEDGNGDAGWFLDFKGVTGVNNGEKLVRDPLLRAGRILFASLLPSDPSSADLCIPGGAGFFYILDATNGARLPFSPFGNNLAGSEFNEEGLVEDGNGGFVAPSATKISGVPSAPTVVQAGNKDFDVVIISHTNSSRPSSIGLERGNEFLGRETWRQLK